MLHIFKKHTVIREKISSKSQCCGSGMFIPDPGYKNSNKREVKKFDVIPFNVATNFTKLYIILVLKCWRKKFGPIFKEL
jgi:hypothetical protein